MNSIMVKGEYLSFEEARDFVRSLKLNNTKEWREYLKSGSKPCNIPGDPAEIYKDKGWISLGDWWGTGFVANKNREFLPFEEAREFVRSLGFKNKQEWEDYCKSGNKPNKIPADPSSNYKDKGWISLGDWLGTGFVANKNREFLPFEEAREFVRSLKLNSGKEWEDYCKSGNKPNNIPGTPSTTYKGKGWISFGDWSGTGSVANKNREFLPFEEAREFVRSLGFKNKQEWKDYCLSGNIPNNIPKDSSITYKDKGYTSVADWLGSNNVKNGFLNFEDAREFVRSLKLNSNKEWEDYCKYGKKPNNIPASPSNTYKDKGWIGLGDWLGVYNGWNTSNILSFIKSLEIVIKDLKPIELYLILQEKGILKVAAITHSYENSNIDILKELVDIADSSLSYDAKQETLNKIIEELEATPEEDLIIEEGDIFENIKLPEDIVSNEEVREFNPFDNLPQIQKLNDLKIIDDLTKFGFISDEEKINFLIRNKVNYLWYELFYYDNIKEIEAKLNYAEENTYFNVIKNTFIEEYYGALNMQATDDFTGKQKVRGNISYVDLNTTTGLMQKLVVHRLNTENRFGNWSGVGSGKTLSAILASRSSGIKNTLVIVCNNTIKGWCENIKIAFPNSHVYRNTFPVDGNEHNYLVVNYEKFQQPNSVDFVSKIIKDFKPDFIILDEVQFAKQRDKDKSRRRSLIENLIVDAGTANPNIKVLGMSATPVLNNLVEAKGLLELVLGKQLNEIKTRRVVQNALNIHSEFVKYGLRYKPRYTLSENPVYPEIDGTSYVNELYNSSKNGNILPIEQVLTKIKVKSIVENITKGTIIYTQYVEGIVDFLKKEIESAGFSVGVFTGEVKEGYAEFEKGKKDVLIASQSISTGIDGLQKVSNRVIINSLPWTSAEFEQLIGRLNRQGSNFDKVDIIIPQVVCRNEDKEWSYDKGRYNLIKYKRTLSDCAVDGYLPGHELPSRETLLNKAHDALQEWINRLEEQGVLNIDRLPIQGNEVEDYYVQKEKANSYLSEINAKWGVSKSQTTHSRLLKDPKEWFEYHKQRRVSIQDWIENPVNKIANFIESRPDWIIGDFGCGEAYLSKALKNTVYSFDHVAINDDVIVCDIANVPIEDNTFDAVVLCLAMMGTNKEDYLKEAYRTLKPLGHLIISEAVKTWDGKDLKQMIIDSGFSIYDITNSVDDKFIYLKSIKS